jgi:hypothetical protein
MKITTAGLVALAIGCGSDDHKAAPDAPIDTPTTPETKTVSGTGTNSNVTDLGVVVTPRDFSTEPAISSLTPNGTGFDRRDGTGTAAGTFTVAVGADAPSWDLELKTPAGIPQFFVSSELAPDLSLITGGRGDATFAGASTTITLNVTGLTTWQDTDALEMMVSNSGSVAFDVESELDTAPGAGDTSITASSFDWSLQGGALVDAAKGDVVKLLQLSTKTTGTDSYQALAKIGSPSETIEQASGGTTTMTIAMTAVPAAETLTTHWKRSQYDALKAQVGPTTMPGTQDLAIDALYSAHTLGFYASAPDLVSFFPSADTTDIDDTFSYGNPFTFDAAPWDEWLISGYELDVPVLADGATNPALLFAGIFEDRLISAPAMDIVPTLSPPRNTKIGGLDLFVPHTGVGLTPTITWDAPSIGTPTSYSITVQRVDANGADTKTTRIATFQTTATSIVIPPNVLTDGSSFVLSISSSFTTGASTQKLFAGTMPDAFATAVTAVFKP